MALEQFKIMLLFWNITNFYLILILILIFLFLNWILLINLHKEYIIIIKTIIVIINQQINNMHFFIYLIFIISILFFIIFCNYSGLIAYVFTITSHIWLTLSLSLLGFLGITLIGFLNNYSNFKYFFIPIGISNIFLLSFLIIIEILSYLIRPLSLAIRLFANMLAGHTLLFILGNSVLSIKQLGFWGLNILALVVIGAVLFLELAIAGIQAYVFFILTIIYLFDMYSVANH